MAKTTKLFSASGNYRPGVAANNPVRREFVIDGLKDFYWAEKKIVEVLPKIKTTTTPCLDETSVVLKQTP